MIADGLELLEGSTIINMTVASGAAFPSSPSTGELFYKTSATTGLYTYDGGGWVAAGGASGIANVVEDVTPQLGGNLDANGNNIITVDAANPTNLLVQAGSVVGASANTGGETIIAGGNGYNTGNHGGRVWALGGAATNAGGIGGNVDIQSGDAYNGTSGSITMLAGYATYGTMGGIDVRCAYSAGTAIGGSIVLTPGGSSGAADGNITIHAPNGVVGAGGIRFRNDTNGSHTTGFYTLLRASTSLASNITLTLPITDGGSGDVMQTDGAGVLSFVTPTAAPVTSVGGNTGVVTNAQIKTSYEANADSNEFSDAEQTKLLGIETGATAGYQSIVINTQAASYTLLLTDEGKYVRMTSASANNMTVPLNSSVAFPTGTEVVVRQAGAGATTIVATGGVTINTSGTLVIAAQHDTVTLIKVGTDAWDLVGATA